MKFGMVVWKIATQHTSLVDPRVAAVGVTTSIASRPFLVGSLSTISTIVFILQVRLALCRRIKISVSSENDIVAS